MNRRDFLLLTALSPAIARDFTTLQSDIYLTDSDIRTLIVVNNRLKRLKKFVGFAHFNYLSFDKAYF